EGRGPGSGRSRPCSVCDPCRRDTPSSTTCVPAPRAWCGARAACASLTPRQPGQEAPEGGPRGPAPSPAPRMPWGNPMHDALVEIAIHAGLVGLLALVAGRGRVRPGWLAIALALMLLRDVLVTRGYGQLPPWVPDSRWNWTGKLLAAGGLLVVAWLP